MAAYIEPRGVARKVELEYSSRVLGRILTMSPRAPGPLTSLSVKRVLGGKRAEFSCPPKMAMCAPWTSSNADAKLT